MKPKTWGFVDVDRYQELAKSGTVLRIYFNGKHVTRLCAKANDETGEVLLLKESRKFRPYIDPVTHNLAREWLTGKVIIQTGKLRSSKRLGRVKDWKKFKRHPFSRAAQRFRNVPGSRYTDSYNQDYVVDAYGSIRRTG